MTEEAVRQAIDELVEEIRSKLDAINHLTGQINRSNEEAMRNEEPPS